MSEDLVVKSNALIQASYSLTLAEQHVILSAITQVRRDEKITDEVFYTVTANALSDVSGFKSKHEYETLKEAGERLWGRTLVVHEKPNGEGYTTAKTRKMRWVQEAVYHDDTGAIQLRFSKPILPYLTALSSEFSQYKFKHIANMKSRYGIRLYELLIQWRTAGEREVEIDWLRQTWGLDGKYPSICDLKKRVLDPAINDINAYSNLSVTCVQRKTGRKVTHFQFKFEPKIKRKTIKKKLTDAEIEAQAYPGETWDQARQRLGGTAPTGS